MRWLLPAVLALLIALAAACGDDDDAAPTATTGAETPAATASAGPTQPPGGGGTTNAFGSTARNVVLARPHPPAGVAIVTDVRVGRHDEEGGFDRIVFEFADALPRGELAYVEEAVQCGSGASVPLAASHILRVQLIPAQAHDDAGQLTIDATEVAGTGESILEAVQICDFEADVTWAVAVNGEKPFRATVLSDPTRLVIDVQH